MSHFTFNISNFTLILGYCFHFYGLKSQIGVYPTGHKYKKSFFQLFFSERS